MLNITLPALLCYIIFLVCNDDDVATCTGPHRSTTTSKRWQNSFETRVRNKRHSSDKTKRMLNKTWKLLKKRTKELKRYCFFPRGSWFTTFFSVGQGCDWRQGARKNLYLCGTYHLDHCGIVPQFSLRVQVPLKCFCAGGIWGVHTCQRGRSVQGV